MFLDFADESDTVWVIGSGRSGTTWLSEILNYNNDYSFYFEPFHPYFVREAEDFYLHHYSYPNGSNKELKSFYNNLFKGNIRNTRIINYDEKYNSNFIYKKRLVKDIFANLSAKCVKNNFPSLKIILVLRNPLSVALSQERHSDWYWLDNPVTLLKQNKLRNNYLRNYTNLIKYPKTYFEKRILVWAIVNSIPLKQFKQDEIHVTFYENLVIKPEEEIKKIFKYLGFENCDNKAKIALTRSYKKQSSTSHKSYNGKIERLQAWQTLPPKKVNKAISILNNFAIVNLYNDNVMPNDEIFSINDFKTIFK